MAGLIALAPRLSLWLYGYPPLKRGLTRPAGGVRDVVLAVDGCPILRLDGWHEMVRRLGVCHIPFAERRGWA